MDYLALAKEKVAELVEYIQLLSEEDQTTIAVFLTALKNNKSITNTQIFNVLNIHKKALRKSFKLHKHAKREYGVKKDEQESRNAN
jgi:hypothetical protein